MSPMEMPMPIKTRPVIYIPRLIAAELTTAPAIFIGSHVSFARRAGLLNSR